MNTHFNKPQAADVSHKIHSEKCFLNIQGWESSNDITTKTCRVLLPLGHRSSTHHTTNDLPIIFQTKQHWNHEYCDIWCIEVTQRHLRRVLQLSRVKLYRVSGNYITYKFFIDQSASVTWEISVPIIPRIKTVRRHVRRSGHSKKRRLRKIMRKFHGRVNPRPCASGHKSFHYSPPMVVLRKITQVVQMGRPVIFFKYASWSWRIRCFKQWATSQKRATSSVQRS